MSSTIVLWILGILIILIAIWALGSYFVVRNIEKPAYTVLEKKDGYEVRQYDAYIVAKTTVSGSNQREILTNGFRVVADYIFGNNTTGTKVAMTAPVISEQKSGKKIAMTAPVISEQNEANEGTVAFVMPSEYSLTTLPRPNDNRVVLEEVPAHTVAVRSFSWYATNARIEKEKGVLSTLLQRDNVVPLNDPYYAGYNPPFTAPFMQRHEVIVDIGS